MIKRFFLNFVVLAFLDNLSLQDFILKDILNKSNIPFVQAIQDRELINLASNQRQNSHSKFLQIHDGDKQRDKIQLKTSHKIIDSNEFIQEQSKSEVKRVSSSGSGSVFGGFIIGVLLIGISIPLIWLNEGKEVRIYNLIQLARKSIKEDFQVNQIKQENDFHLVYCNGKLSAPLEVKDSEFGLQYKNCIKLIRTVEMYQYVQKETVHKDEQGNEHTQYHYSLEWSEQVIDSEKFIHHQNHRNPNKMPFLSKSIHNEKVELGQFILNDEQIKKVNNLKECILNQELAQQCYAQNQQILEQFGYGKIELKQSHLFCRLQSIEGQTSDEDRIGDLKIMWKQAPDGEDVTIIAQQIQNEKGQTTFRQWNPKKLDVSFGSDNSFEIEKSCPDSCCCCLCNLVQMGMGQLFQEVINVQEEGTKQSKEIFDEMEASNHSTTKIIRLIAWIFIVLGFYLFFSPLISLLSWIPLIGSLLGSVLGFVIFLIALVIGSLIFLLVFALAWIRYRPLFGILILTLVSAVTIGLIIFSLQNSSDAAPAISSSSTNSTLTLQPILDPNQKTY